MTNLNKNYHVATYGCQMNEHESEKIEGMLNSLGCKKYDDIKTADIIVVNTCCIRESAESKIISNIGFLKTYKKKNEDLIVIICGCLTQQKDLAKKLFTRFKHINIIIGTQNLHMIPKFLMQTINEDKRILAIEDDELNVYEDIPVNRYNKPFAFVNVMYGCDNYCAYCIVPYVRGNERSRTPEKILEEVKSLADEGYKELMLLGQNVNSYGSGLENAIDFSQLLDMINAVDGIERIRFMTSHPKDLSTDLIKVFKDRGAMCNHIHLPVQSGSDRVLKLMNRKYDSERYLSLINDLRAISPDIAITTDIIVGFPSETEDDFEQTLELVKKAQFDSAYTFKYSKRSGTKAAKMDCHITDNVKKDRLARLIEVQNEITASKNKSMLGKTVRVLVEGIREKNGQYFGKTDCFKLVNFDSDVDVTGQFVDLKITRSLSFSLIGEVIK
jgi:tRNA-2-methylthio-N6-dimethylallyladenosine synthase